MQYDYEKDLLKFREAAAAFTKDALRNPEAAREALYKTGMYCKGGRLKPEYRGDDV